MLDGILEGLDEAAAEGGVPAGDFDGVEHSIAVDVMVRGERREVRVRAVLDVGAAVEAGREGALRHVAGSGRELVGGGEVGGEYAFGIEVERKILVEEAGYQIMQRLEDCFVKRYWVSPFTFRCGCRNLCSTADHVDRRDGGEVSAAALRRSDE